MNIRLLPLAVLLCYALNLTGQDDYIKNPDVINAMLIKTSLPMREINISPKLSLDTTKFAKPGFHPKKDWPLNDYIDKTALPLREDLGVQKIYTPENISRTSTLDFDGIGPTNVDPADPSIAIGPNHVVQMVNSPSGAKFKIWDKEGNILLNETYFDGLTDINGAGDPIVLYDERDDRWLLSEFSSEGNKLIIALSTGSDPLGSYYIYSFTTPNFPDYPKYGIWSDAYIVTTNEDGVSPVYALDREKMLNGDPEVTAQRFTIPEFPTLNFQAATPVGMTGTNLPPSGSPALIMRMADDAWSTEIPEDRLEIWEFNIDFEDESNTSLTGPIIFLTEAFDSNLCGFTNYACIDQPDTGLNLDPLREVLMNKIVYRNFGDYESIVCSHVTDADGNDRAGIRWYELRNEGSGWEIYQQSTYAPDYDNASRWMSSISINENGSIGLAYNISSNTIYPSIRYTGRTPCDPLGQMTLSETTIKEGSSKNNSNRWGDYSCLDFDPSDGSFWYTAGYSINNSWDTHIANFIIEDECIGISITTEIDSINLCQGEDFQLNFQLSFDGGYSESTVFELLDFPAGLDGNFSENNVNQGGEYSLTISNTNQIPGGIYPFKILALSEFDNEEISLSLFIDEEITNTAILQYPINQSNGASTLPCFDWDELQFAANYQLEIALDESFTQNFQIIPNISNSYFQLQLELEQSTNYFWRIKAQNGCNESNYSEIFTFTTGMELCYSLNSEDIPIEISSSGTPTINSIIHFPTNGLISEISISNINISHSYISDLKITLISPIGTEVIILDGICGSNDNMDLSIQDNDINPINCPPTDGLSYSPAEELSAFFNEQATGNWTLQIKDEHNYDGGSLNFWSLEICTIIESIDCVSDLEITSDPIDDGIYQASGEILSTGMIPSTGNVIFNAGQAVELDNGFEIQAGSIFEINIANCDN